VHRRMFLAGSALTIAKPVWARAAGTPSASPASGTFAHPEWFFKPIPPAAVSGHMVMFGSRKEYLAQRIPTTDYLDWPDLDLKDSSATSVEAWTTSTVATLHDHGIAVGAPLTICDWGTAYAPRLFWVLTYLGSNDLAILNGGMPAWIAAGGDIESGEIVIDYVQIKDATVTPNAAVLATIDAVQQAVTEQSAQFIDARTAAEFAKGHLPGAANVPFLANTVDSSGGVWKTAADLNSLYADAGIDLSRPIIPYCSTGVRSAATWFTLAALGAPKVSLFSGSWREWTTDPTRPVET